MYVIRHYAVRVESKNVAIAIVQTLLNEISDPRVLHPDRTTLFFVQGLFKLHKPTAMKVEQSRSLLLIYFERCGVRTFAYTSCFSFKPPLFLFPLLQNAFGNGSREAECYEKSCIRWLNMRQLTPIELLTWVRHHCVRQAVSLSLRLARAPFNNVT